MNNFKSKYLSKEEEIKLGYIVQDMIQAKKDLKVIEQNLKDKTFFTPEKEINNLKKRIKKGDAAVEKLVKAYTGLVYNQAKKYKIKYPSSPDLEDLIQEGMVGLITGIHRYDPTRNNKVSTCVTFWVFQAITRGSNKTARMVRLPENRITEYTKILSIKEAYSESDLSTTEIDEIIIKELNITKNDLWYINNAASSPTSLNKIISSDDSSQKELIEIVSTETAPSSEEEVITKNIHDMLKSHFNKLNNIQKDVVSSSYNIDCFDNDYLTPKQVREKHNISPTIYKKNLRIALQTIQNELTEKGLTISDFNN